MEKYLESPLFARITGEEAERMLNCAKARYRDYNAGSIIFGEDDKPNIRNLLDIQAKNNLQMTKKLHIVTNTTLKQKIALWILEVSEDGKKAVMDMNREELADYLGVTRPSLSRTMMEMQKQGLIRIEGKTVWILNAEELGKIMEDER